ncbi:Transcription elongation factor GreA [Candidatus Izimaplasma bacterium HR1]|jgi:transcription elongation factor GreA|uniref:transcription elongation factor GreA n=1 Tax=Candidatus Izimoplasma sp. HR1 TaxID=1541959 RepID=UPI0004F79C36|nr:Transcription elongation factor GreA [Candidatus Izimaplasma bacterium HR1]
MEKTYKLTKQGLLDLQNEIERLKTEDRARNLEALKDARAQGDLSENADYDAARDEQAQIEARIKEIEGILKDYEIIKEDHTNKVNIGKTVVIKVGEFEEQEYTIVGSLEADPLNNKISNESPIGKGIIGSKKGKTVTVKTETGREVKVKIVDVK